MTWEAMGSNPATASSCLMTLLYLNDELGFAFADGERAHTDVAEVDVDVAAHLVAGDGLAQLVNLVGELGRGRTWKHQEQGFSQASSTLDFATELTRDIPKRIFF